MGSRIAFLPEYSVPTIRRELAGDEGFSVRIPFGSPGSEMLKEKAVLRTVYEDLTYEEWRIEKLIHTRNQNGEREIEVDAVAIKFDLADCCRVAQIQANGQVDMDFDPPALALDDHIALITGSPGFPAHIVADAMPDVDPVEISYQRETPWSAIQAIAKAASLEPDLIREAGLYAINLRARIGSDAPVARLRYAKNIVGLTRTLDTSRLATRVFPFGAEVDGFALTIADATWEITGIEPDTKRIQLADSPVAFTDQCNGLILRVVYGLPEFIGTDFHVTDTFPGDDLEIEMDTIYGLSVGCLVQFRDPSGNELVYLDRPTSIAQWGIHAPPDVGQFSDIPFVNNLLREAFLDADPLTAWAAVGAAALTRIIDRVYHRFGTASQRVQCTSDGDGIQGEWQGVSPIGPVRDDSGTVIAEGKPFFNVQVAFWIITGTVRLELDVDTVGDGSTIVTYPDTGARATSSEHGQWIESLSMNVDLYEIGAKRVRVRLVQDGSTAADFYLDAAQLTQSAAGAATFYDKRASNELWHAALLALAEFGEPIATYDVEPIDLFRQDQDAFEADELVIGGSVVVDDSNLGATAQARIVALEQAIADDLTTTLRISNTPQMLTRLQAEEAVRRRLSLGTGGGGTGTGTGGSGGGTSTPPPSGSTPGGALSSFTVELVEDSGSWYHKLTWNHNQAVQDDGAARFTATVYGNRGLDDEPTTALETAVDPKLEFDTTDTVPLVGSYRELVHPTVVEDFYYTFRYRIDLYDGATIVDTRNVSISGFYEEIPL